MLGMDGRREGARDGWKALGMDGRREDARNGWKEGRW